MKKLWVKFKEFFNKRFGKLETVEEKSFWILAILIAFLGLVSFTTAENYKNPISAYAMSILFLLFPIIMMIVVSINRNYHLAYPILCIVSCGISIPLAFITSGGFMSAMPIFCAATTAITALCYDRRWRITSLIFCLLTNTVIFIYVYIGNPDIHIEGTQILFSNDDLIKALQLVYDDLLLGYYCCVFALYVLISFVVRDIRKYKLNQDTLQRYFDNEKRNEILRHVIDIDGDYKAEHKKACILFADISNFTPISEKLSSDVTSDLLRVFFTTAGKHIHDTNGIIDKYIGDCVMAYWIDEEGQNCVLKAVTAMLKLKQDIYAQSEELFKQYGTEINFSVGLAYGDVILGDIGSDKMHDFTVIGDAVNTASRIQGFAVSGEMLVSDEAAEKIKEDILLENVEFNHFFKGKNRPIDVYRVIGFATEKRAITLNDKSDYGYKLTICGCRGSFPVSGIRFHEYGGETSCYVIKKDDYAVIVDCGTGLKNAVDLISDCKKIDILLTHVHYDHILGFLMTRFPKDAEVKIYGHFEAWDGANTLEDFMQHPYWPVELIRASKININVGEEIKISEDFKATFYPSDHPDDACVIKLMCKDKKLAFLADCENAEKLDKDASEGAEIVFFDGMFDDEDVVSHKGWGHGTWQEGVRFLENKEIKRLIITHHSPELGDRSLIEKENKAREMNQKVSFAKAGEIYII